MPDKVTASRSTQPTASVGDQVTASSTRQRRSDLQQAVEGWLQDGKAQGWSTATLQDRQATLQRVCWWLEHEDGSPVALASLTPHSVRSLLAYVREPNSLGRFGSNRPSAKREARPATANAYFRILRAFVNFCIAEGLLQETPLKNVKAPRVPVDQIQPFSGEQVQSLLDAARRRQAPERNVALILLLVDTGMRSSEITGLLTGDVDRTTGALTVTGKGNKKRQVFMGPATRRALGRHMESDRRDSYHDEPLFASVGGHTPGARLSHTGIHRIIQEAGKAAKIQGTRCSPHTLRHTFAVNFLRGGGNLFELQQIMGHTDLTVLRRYVALAESDLAEAHRSASPVERLKLR